MGKFYFFLVIISLLVISGCSKDDNPVTTTTKGTISGKITDQASGNVISGASISTQPATTNVTSDNAGNYTISNVEAGSYSLTVTMSGYVSKTSNVSVTVSQNSVVNISLSLTPTTKGTISGKITDQASGNVISGASISTQPATMNVTSDNAGNYTISDVEAGSYSLTVTMSGYVSNTSNVNVTANQNSVVNISLSLTPVPDPVASFNYGGSMVTPAVITFQNTSQNADSYLWEFGDGTTSTATNPSKTYNTRGIYTVKLTASNTVTGKSNLTSQNLVITPGKVFLQRVIVDEIPFVDGNGAGWDLTNGPDVFFTIIDSVGTVIIDGSGSRVEDVTPSMLPLTWEFNSPGQEFSKSSWNKTYFIRVWDWDATGDDHIGTTNGFKIIQQVNANYPTTVSLQSSDAKTKVRLILRWE